MTERRSLPLSPPRASKVIVNPKKVGTFYFPILFESLSPVPLAPCPQILVFPGYPPNGLSVTELSLL